MHYPYSEVISTRKVKSDDGILFLDMKCGNLMQQRVTRIQTDQAHEISRLIRQYITIQQRVQQKDAESNLASRWKFLFSFILLFNQQPLFIISFFLFVIFKRREWDFENIQQCQYYLYFLWLWSSICLVQLTYKWCEKHNGIWSQVVTIYYFDAMGSTGLVL